MIFKVGQRVRCIEPSDGLRRGDIYVVLNPDGNDGRDMTRVNDKNGKSLACFSRRFEAVTSFSLIQGAKTMFNEIKSAVVEFIKEHKNLILGITVAFLLDEFVFKGKFRERLVGIMDKCIKKIEEKLA